jgi:hypothetical protein
MDGDKPVTKPLGAHRTAEREYKRTQTFMLLVRFEPTTPVFERAKTDQTLDRAATVIGKRRQKGRDRLPRISTLSA